MYGPLLIGITAFGVAWAWCFRGHRTTQAVIDTKDAAGGTAEPATVSTEVQQSQVGLDAVKSAVDSESSAPTVGDIPVAGSDGGQVLPAELNPTEGGLIIPGDKSTGGADPSTQQTAIHTDDTPPAITQGDTESLILQSKYGAGGGTGLTDQQISNTIRDSAIWSGEVF
jgi:hypothetical protein